MVRPTRLEGFRFSMVRPTGLRGRGRVFFQWSAQRAWKGFRFSMVCPTGLEGVSFFSSSPNVSDFDMWRHANPLNSHTARAPCYMCYMCYMGLTRQPARTPTLPGLLAICAICTIWVLHANPLNSHTAWAPCYMCYMYYMGLTRQPAELCTIHIASQHVPNMHCIAHIVHFNARTE